MAMTTARTTRGPWAVLCCVLVGALMAVIDVTIVNVAVPSIRASLGTTIGEIELVITGYTVAYASLLVTGGRLGDMLGRRRMFLCGLALFTLSSAACGAAPMIGLLIAARTTQGVGAAMLFPQVLAIIQVTFPDADRPKALGVFGSVIGIGAIAGQLIGGLLLALDLFGLGWRQVFLVNVPIGVVAIIAASVILPKDEPGEHGHIDWLGVVLATSMLILFIVPLLEGREAGWPLWTILSLVAVIPVAITFVRHEIAVAARGGTPLVRMDLFANRGFARGVPLAMLFTASYAGFLLLLSVYLQIGLRFTPLAAALVYAPNAVGFFVASLIAPRLTRQLGRHALTLGYLLAALGLLGVTGTVAAAGADIAGWQLAPVLFVAGLGQGLGMTPLIGTIIGTLSGRDAGAGAGVVTMTLQVGNAVGVATMSLVFFGVLGTATSPGSYAHAYSTALPVTAALMIVAALLVLRLPATAQGNPLLERLPGWASGFAYSTYLMTGGRLGDRFFHNLLEDVIDRRVRRIAEAPRPAGDFLAHHYRSARASDRRWLGYLVREALAHGDGAVAHEDERGKVIADQVDEIRGRQATGDFPADLDPKLLRLMSFALVNYPQLLPQITRMTTGRTPDDPEFGDAWTEFLREVGNRLAAALPEHAAQARVGPPGRANVAG
ncbi:MAG TPA: MFS transporter [Pseudonocardiaceae bacterium]|nr:MFS transporter [Pseudonocardiaceae bacterium]